MCVFLVGIYIHVEREREGENLTTLLGVKKVSRKDKDRHHALDKSIFEG